MSFNNILKLAQRMELVVQKMSLAQSQVATSAQPDDISLALPQYFPPKNNPDSNKQFRDQVAGLFPEDMGGRVTVDVAPGNTVSLRTVVWKLNDPNQHPVANNAIISRINGGVLALMNHPKPFNAQLNEALAKQNKKIVNKIEVGSLLA